MNNDLVYIDLSYHSLNKYGEELCGDKVEIVKTKDKTIIVLADGLGSGVKANILATLTSKIMITMLEKGANLKETIDTITNTLPVCSIRQLAYSTFSILEIDNQLKCRIIEFDNPPTFVVRDHKIVELSKEVFYSSGKKVLISEIDLKVGDELTLCSDGVIHAGVGRFLNHGWEWVHVAEFLVKQRLNSAANLNRRLIESCNRLYDEKPGDDTTAVTVKIKLPQKIHLFTGPPEDETLDHDLIKNFMREEGKKIVCGGTAANIVSRELNREIITDISYIDPNIPPMAIIKGIDLVTEGVLTLKMVLDRLREINKNCVDFVLTKEDAVSKLLKYFIEDSTHIYFSVGHAINPAHQNPDFPEELSIKINVVRDLIEELKIMGKIVILQYTDR
ncbi:SpoIIE family protein phosphatase [Clostridiaceae bacterium HSG29]|nr:SpoIIE family protein phosphatase [Clostridiaceae bacterium HSG29]